MTTRRSRLLVIIVSTTLATGMCELWLRHVGGVFHDRFTQPDNDRGWSLRPGFGGWTKGERVMWLSINSAGMHDREHPVTAPPRTIRVAVLGDSYTQGLTVPADKTFPAFLERRLATCVTASGWAVEVLNFGVTGYGTAQEWLTYRHHAASYRPDVVILAVYTNNDIYNNHRRLNPTAYPEQSPYFTVEADRLVLDASFRSVLAANAVQPWWRRLRMMLTERLRVAQLLHETWGAMRPFLITSSEAAEDADGGGELDLEDAIYAPPATADIAEAWRVTEAILKQWASEVRADAAEPWIVTLANNAQIDPHPAGSLDYPDRRIRDVADAIGIASMSLAGALAEHVASTGMAISGGYSETTPPGSGHWNEHGNLVAANLLGDRMCLDSEAIARRRGP